MTLPAVRACPPSSARGGGDGGRRGLDDAPVNLETGVPSPYGRHGPGRRPEPGIESNGRAVAVTGL